jgi:hypothetical protein
VLQQRDTTICSARVSSHRVSGRSVTGNLRTVRDSAMRGRLGSTRWPDGNQLKVPSAFTAKHLRTYIATRQNVTTTLESEERCRLRPLTATRAGRRVSVRIRAHSYSLTVTVCVRHHKAPARVRSTTSTALPRVQLQHATDCLFASARLSHRTAEYHGRSDSLCAAFRLSPTRPRLRQDRIKRR